MGLSIVSMKQTTIKDPYEIWNDCPNEEDFTYRNDPERYKRDCEAFDTLIKEYEDDQSDAQVNCFQIGYGAFKKLREQLARPLGFHYFVKDENNPFSWWLSQDRSDSKETEMLQDFFLHSDCDGSFDNEHICNLLYALCMAPLSKTREISRYDEFFEFVKESAIQNLHWEFG